MLVLLGGVLAWVHSLGGVLVHISSILHTFDSIGWS